jgi:sec-independent protein translocase protein TatB
MFGVDTSELILVAVLALIFIGPKDLPMTLRTVGRWVGQVRGMARHFHSGIENIIREAELEEMEKKWREENDRIMREYPALLDASPPDTTPQEAAQPSLPLDPQPEQPPEKRELP